jgi:hypothetical protein
VLTAPQLGWLFAQDAHRRFFYGYRIAVPVVA